MAAMAKKYMAAEPGLLVLRACAPSLKVQPLFLRTALSTGSRWMDGGAW